VLHVATVHFASPRWIEIQTRHLREHIPVPYETWTSLQGIDASYGSAFDHVFDQAGIHPGKLNHLAVEISQQADDDDLILFLDGDAFPIADPMPLIEEGLSRAPLVAVRRAENGGDEQPHPCFCATTVKTWRELPGDWSAGYKWKLSDGTRATDIGGNLLRVLEVTDTPWVDVLRTNRAHMDPLFFAIYGDVVYHHGAGFRRGGSSRGFYDAHPKPLPLPQTPLLRGVSRQIERVRLIPWRLRTRVPQILESKRVYEKIQRGDPDWIAYVS
jgi:hypothetical protein